MYRLLPVIFMLALSPGSEKKLEVVSSFVTAAKDSVASIRNGIDTFYAAMMPFMVMSQAEKKPGQTGDSPAPGGTRNSP